MTLKTGLVAATLVVCSIGCDKKEQDSALSQGQAVVSKAADLAGNAWKAASEQANKVSADSGKSAIEAAKVQMEAARDKLSQIKAPSNLDGLKMDSVKEQIQRLQAALTIQHIKEAMDRRVKIVMQMKDNAEKTADDVKAKLAAADKEYKDLQQKLDSAQSTYNSASNKIDEVEKKLQGVN